VAVKKRVEGEPAAFVAARYGLGGLTPTYDQFVSLWLNLPATQAAANFHAAVAATVAAGSPLPDDWIRAALDTPTEVSRWRTWDLRRTTRG
jgi:hypothetical protein